MSRRRNPSAAERAIVRLVEMLAPVDPARPEVAMAPQPELMAIRHLGLAQLGRWVEIPGTAQAPSANLEPSSTVTAGRLVGLRPGIPAAGRRDHGVTRILVLQQGSSLAPLEVAVNRPVNVAPREWS